MTQKRNTSGERLNVGVAWYSRAQWNRLRELADDKDALDDSYEDWLEGWNKFTKHGPFPKDQLIRVEVDVDELAWWCQARNLPLDGKARSEFVTEKVSQVGDADKK